MTHKIHKLPQSEVEITITVSPDEQLPYLQKAARTIANEKAIKGFRKGKAPYDIVKKHVGEMALLHKALEYIVEGTYPSVVLSEKLETIGAPSIHIEKVAPGNEVVYKAKVAIFPEITIGNIKKIKLSAKPEPIEEKDVMETIDALRGMKATEVLTNDAATKEDKVVIDLSMFIDNVAVDGGTSKDYSVYLSEDHYIPGFNDELIGLKQTDKKTFELTFPKEHYQKQLAGKNVRCDVTIKGVYKRELPELNDDFAISLGQKNLEELKSLIKENREKESEQKAKQKQEIELLDQLIEQSDFGDIPQIVIDHEKQKMFHELKHSLEKNNVTIAQYLEDIKKKEDELLKEFTEQATKRAKAAFISRQLAKEHADLVATEQEIKEEVEKVKKYYEQQAETIDFSKPEIKESIATSIQNKKVMEWLFTEVTK